MVVSLTIATAIAAVCLITGNMEGIVLAVAPLLGGFAWDRLQLYADRRRIVSQALAKRRPPKVTDARLADVLGSGLATHEGPSPYPKQVDYLRGRLVAALEGTLNEHCLLVQGEHGTGMARTAYEALVAAGRELDDQGKTVKVLPPKTPRRPEKLSKLLALDPFPFDTSFVLWLDELYDYLQPGGLTVEDLRRLAELDPPAVVLATIQRRSKDAIEDPDGIAVLREFGANTVFIDDPLTSDEPKRRKDGMPPPRPPRA